MKQQPDHASPAILVVEDNAAQLKTLIDILETEGLQPISCMTGREALAACQLDDVDVHVAILDLRLTDMDGLEVLTRLRQQIPDMQVIIHTGYATLDSAMEAINKEAFAFVQKMGNVEELLTHVHRAFHAHLAGYSEQLEREVVKRTAELSAANDALQQKIAERKRAEENIRTLNKELEHRVSQRTAELENANKELNEFAHVVSHDLKAPLRGISRLAHWLAEDYAGVIDEQGQEMTELLIGRVKRLDSLIDGILKYSRIGRVIGEKKQIDLNRLVRDVVDMIAPPDHIHITIENDLPVIVGDTIRMIQVFQNLLSNAVEFMDKSEGRIAIGCIDEGSHWTFSVADNGPGIDAKYHEKIFRIFQTLTPRDVRESTGIGLALVKKIVELHGGEIRVEAVVGKSSTFFFTLPKKERHSYEKGEYSHC